MSTFYFADIEDCGMIFAKWFYPTRKDCVNVAHNMGDSSITSDDVDSTRAKVLYDANGQPEYVELCKNKKNTIPVWVIKS